MNIAKRSYESLVYIPVREMEPVKIYDSNTKKFDCWLDSLFSQSGWFNWTIKTDYIKDPEIVWKMKDDLDPLDETFRDNSLGTD